MKNTALTSFCLVLITVLCLQNQVQAQYQDLVKHVPETANALVLVDAQAIFSSSMAQRENWQSNRDKQFEAGLTSIPPKAERVLIASDFDIEQMQANWEVAIGKMRSDVSVSTLAERFGGVEDKVESMPVVRLPDNSFIVEFPDGLFGSMAPGNRQSVSAWINHSNRRVSTYLQDGVRFAELGTGVIMALDLQGAFAVNEVERGIERFKSVRESKIDRTKLSQLLASLKGVMLGITFRDKAYAKIKIDFGQDATILSEIAKPFTLDVLGEYGVMIDEIAQWEPEIKGQEVFLGGELTYHGLTRLASLVQLPSPALHAHAHATAAQDKATAGAGGQDEKSPGLTATQEYYEAVQRKLKNLRSRKGDMRTMGQVAQWFENYGRLVDKLPTLNVDKEMLQYGSYISSQLHGAAMMLKGTTINRRTSEMGAASSARIYGGALGNVSQDGWQQGSYGFYGRTMGGNYGRRRETNAMYGLAARGGIEGAGKSELRQQQQAITQVHAQAKAQAATSVQQIVQNIETATTQIRQSMTDKYQVQF